MGGRTFECLDAVINRYRKEQIVEGHTLQHPVSLIMLYLHMYAKRFNMHGFLFQSVFLSD